MKEKLQQVKEALELTEEFVSQFTGDDLPNQNPSAIVNEAKEALTLLDSIIEMLDSPEIVDKIRVALCKQLEISGSTHEFAKVAMEIIRGK